MSDDDHSGNAPLSLQEYLLFRHRVTDNMPADIFTKALHTLPRVPPGHVIKTSLVPASKAGPRGGIAEMGSSGIDHAGCTTRSRNQPMA